MGCREASSSLVARSKLRKSPKAMKKALGLFSCAGRTFSSLSRRDRCAGSRWEPCLRTSSFGCPLSFVRSELATEHRRAVPVCGFCRKPQTGALPRKQGASSAAGGACPAFHHGRTESKNSPFSRKFWKKGLYILPKTRYSIKEYAKEVKPWSWTSWRPYAT